MLRRFNNGILVFEGLIYSENGRRNECQEARLTPDNLPAACVLGFLAYMKLITAMS